jgi:DNA polymerase V
MVPTIENYSIDESFLNLDEFREREVEPLARELRERVQRWVGIPTCVGIAPTKTLAKVANFIAKKRPQYRGVCDLRSNQVRADLLSTVPVDEVWGIGAASAAKLAKIGVQTAADLAALDPDNARALMAFSRYLRQESTRSFAESLGVLNSSKSGAFQRASRTYL